MMEISPNPNPQEYNKFLKALKNNANYKDKLVDSLTKVEKPKLPKKQKFEENQKFKKHPDRIESKESLISVKNEYSDKSISFLYKSSHMTESQSDENLLYKCSAEDDFQSLPLLQMANEPDSISPKKRVRIKCTPKVKSGPKHQEDAHPTRCTTDKIQFVQKLESLLSNILNNSEKIRITLDVGITPPDGDEEWARRYARAKEFYSRFSRNYLYRLGRQVTDLENHYIKCSGRSSNRTIENIQQHILAVFNVILNALQAYYSHMQTSLSYVAIDKLMNIYESVCKCCVIMNKFLEKEGANFDKFVYRIMEVSNLSHDMVDKLAQILFEMPQLYCLTLPAAKLMQKGYKWEIKIPSKKKPAVRKTQLDMRLSMYSMSSNIRSKNNNWKKTITDLTKEKFRYGHVQSRYKTAVFKHRLPIEKPSVIDAPARMKYFDKSSSSLLRNTPLLTPEKEDDIETMVEREHKREKDIPKSQKLLAKSSTEKICSSKQMDVLTPLIRGLCYEICTQDGKNVTEEKLESLLKNFLGMALDGKINNNTSETPSIKNGTIMHPDPAILKLDLSENNEPTPNSPSPAAIDKFQHSNNNKKDLHSYVDFIKNVRQDLYKNNTHVKSRKLKSCTSVMETIESVTDADSNKFCVENQHKVVFRDDSRLNNNKEGKKKRRQTVSVTGERNAQLICIRDEDSIIEVSEEENISKNKNQALMNLNNKCINVEIRPKDKQLSKEVIKISHLPKKSLKKLKLLPTNIIYGIVKYKIEYKKFSRQNVMYRKSSTIQPWEIVDFICDGLLNELLFGVAREIEDNDILKNIYESEFC